MCTDVYTYVCAMLHYSLRHDISLLCAGDVSGGVRLRDFPPCT